MFKDGHRLLTRRASHLAAAIVLLFTICASAVPGAAESVRYISVQTGHSTVVPVDNMRRVAVGDADVVGVVAIGTSQLIINGKAPGHTSVFVWSGGTRSTYEVMVTNQVLDTVAQMLRAAISLPDVQVVSFGQSIMVRGSVADMAQFVQLNDIVDRFHEFAHENHASIVNAVTVSHSLESIQHEFAGTSGVSELAIEPDAKGNVIRKIDIGAEISGHTFVDGIIYVLRGQEKPNEDWRIARLDAREETPAVKDLADLLADPPVLHQARSGGPVSWTLDGDVLAYIDANVGPGSATSGS